MPSCKPLRSSKSRPSSASTTISAGSIARRSMPPGMDDVHEVMRTFSSRRTRRRGGRLTVLAAQARGLGCWKGARIRKRVSSGQCSFRSPNSSALIVAERQEMLKRRSRTSPPVTLCSSPLRRLAAAELPHVSLLSSQVIPTISKSSFVSCESVDNS
ncbi:hypothetical protein Vretimale_5522 [Volvox reticuliferus]|uniref:Uncharacterized protein n=1 Tax=Volvox reticuliferus TaxID=1737510 RepID=A0A8J4G5N4_9CHLO|nr:hypothetical protein Vretimale_5522 [Volvox reticuliferus]